MGMTRLWGKRAGMKCLAGSRGQYYCGDKTEAPNSCRGRGLVGEAPEPLNVHPETDACVLPAWEWITAPTECRCSVRGCERSARSPRRCKHVTFRKPASAMVQDGTIFY